MLRDKIREDVHLAIGDLFGDRIKNVFKVELVRSKEADHGDYSTNIALRISRDVKQTPVEIAKKLTDSLSNLPYIEKLEVKEPGFVNFFIKDDYWQDQVNEVLKLDKKFGSNEISKGKKARVEFVSANPTGPLHFGNARGGPIGDALASVLEFSGYKVVREYYHNDVGVQVQKLGESIVNIQNGKKLEEQEYKGEYVLDLLKHIQGQKSKVKSQKLTSEKAGKAAVELLLAEVIVDCKEIGIDFDEIYKESDLLESGKTKSSIAKIDKFLKKKEGATWFAPSDDFLKDRETVVVKSDRSYTYFANDIAYHDIKFEEKPDLVIDIFGANHHGHVPRLQAAINSLGYDQRKFHVILYQWVRFKKGGEVVKMSKRLGTFITAREVLDEIGRDALRFFILMYDANTPIDFDLDLAREKTTKNPVYYVQYAYARICSILSKVDSLGKHRLRSDTLSVTIDGPLGSSMKGEGNKTRRSLPREHPHRDVSFNLLTTEYELNLIKQITRLPELVEDISKNFAVNQLTTYATELADSFHSFYENCKVITDDSELTSARLNLVEATRITLYNTLSLLGVSAPEKM